SCFVDYSFRSTSSKLSDFISSRCWVSAQLPWNSFTTGNFSTNSPSAGRKQPNSSARCVNQHSSGATENHGWTHASGHSEPTVQPPCCSHRRDSSLRFQRDWGIAPNRIAVECEHRRDIG